MKIVFSKNFNLIQKEMVVGLLFIFFLQSLDAGSCTRCRPVKVGFSGSVTVEHPADPKCPPTDIKVTAELGGSVFYDARGTNPNYAYHQPGVADLRPFQKYDFTVMGETRWDIVTSCWGNVWLGGGENTCYVLFLNGVEAGTSARTPTVPGATGKWEVELRPKEMGGSPGSSSTSRGSVRWTATFGENPDGTRIGSLNIYKENIDASLYSPAVLTLTVNESNPSNEVIRTGGVVRQVKTLQSFVDIQTISPSEYEVKFYLPSQVGQKTIDGFFSLTGAPTYIYRFENPDSASTNRFRITKIKGPRNTTHLFTQDIPSNSWIFETNNGSRLETSTEIVNASSGDRIVTTTISQISAAKILKKTREIYRQFAWGTEELVKRIEDPDGDALTTEYVYYTDSSDHNNYTKLEAMINPNGSWEKYAYYPNNSAYYGRLAKTYRPYKSSPATYNQAADSNCSVTEVQYGFSK